MIDKIFDYWYWILSVLFFIIFFVSMCFNGGNMNTILSWTGMWACIICNAILNEIRNKG